MPDKEPFPLEKILTASATEYCASTGQSIDNFLLVGIHVEQTTIPGSVGYFEYDEGGPPYKKISRNVPKGAEVVVGFVTQGDGSRYHTTASATAMIPRNMPRDQSKEDNPGD